MKTLDLSILIVSYNTRELTLQCLESVYFQTSCIAFEVIVVDNDSHDGSVDSIKKGFPQVRLFAEKKNHGFARGTNIAAEYACGEYLLLLNPDTVILDGAVQKLMSFAINHPEAGVVGGRTLFPDGSLNPSSCWGKQTLWSTFLRTLGISSFLKKYEFFNPEEIGCWQRDTVREVDIVTGCLFLIRNNLWKQMEGLDEKFFMYGEEADLCLRIWDTGLKCMIDPNVNIIHYDGASEKIRSEKIIRLFSAKALLFKKHRSAFAALIGIILLDVLVLNRIAALMILSSLKLKAKEDLKNWIEIWHGKSRWHSVQT